MREDGRLRTLVVGDATWLWSVRHRHRPACHEVLSLHRRHRRGARTTLRILFPAGPGRFVAEGHWHAGSVTNGEGDLLNLHEPGTVHRFLTAATARGLVPEAPGETRIDGWPLFDTLIGR